MTNYIYPTIVSMPLGYTAMIPFDVGQIAERLTVSEADIRVKFVVFQNGGIAESEERIFSFANGKMIGGSAEPFSWSASEGATDQAFAELHFEAADNRSIFSLNAPFQIYAIYSAPGKKSFFSDNSYKYGSPPIIDQMAMFGQFVETMTVINLDRKRDLGETLVFINPYKRAINVRILADDGQVLPKFQVKPLSCLHYSIADLMGDRESWRGQIQLTANNRLVVFHIKHSLADPRVISDHEHLDPFRADDTHWPLTLLFRTVPGKIVGAAKRKLRSLRA